MSGELNVAAAEQLAEDVLFPAANELDALPVLPRERLDLLADLGWYGLSSPSSGLDFASAAPILEAFAGGCLTTTFVWMQHLGTPPACAFGPEHLRPWVEPLASGARRSTVAFGGLLPSAPLRARQEGDDWIVDGVAPWVSGWGLGDLIHVAARTPDDDVVWLLVDAPSPGISAQPLRLLAVNASATVTLSFDGVRVEGARQTSRFPWTEWPAHDAAGLRTNGSLALGVAGRCCRLIGPSPLDDELVAPARPTRCRYARNDAGRAGRRRDLRRASSRGTRGARGKWLRRRWHARRTPLPRGHAVARLRQSPLDQAGALEPPGQPSLISLRLLLMRRFFVSSLLACVLTPLLVLPGRADAAGTGAAGPLDNPADLAAMQRFEALIPKFTFGGMVTPVYLDKWPAVDRNATPNRMVGEGDSGNYTGVYLAAQSWRYAQSKIELRQLGSKG